MKALRRDDILNAFYENSLGVQPSSEAIAAFGFAQQHVESRFNSDLDSVKRLVAEGKPLEVAVRIINQKIVGGPVTLLEEPMQPLHGLNCHQAELKLMKLLFHDIDEFLRVCDDCCAHHKFEPEVAIIQAPSVPVLVPVPVSVSVPVPVPVPTHDPTQDEEINLDLNTPLDTLDTTLDTTHDTTLETLESIDTTFNITFDSTVDTTPDTTALNDRTRLNLKTALDVTLLNFDSHVISEDDEPIAVSPIIKKADLDLLLSNVNFGMFCIQILHLISSNPSYFLLDESPASNLKIPIAKATSSEPRPKRRRPHNISPEHETNDVTPPPIVNDETSRRLKQKKGHSSWLEITTKVCFFIVRH